MTGSGKPIQGKVWVWDRFPLSVWAWPNRQMEITLPPGHEVTMYGPMRYHMTYEDGSRGSPYRRSRQGYRPTETDLVTLKETFPGADPDNPAWPLVKARLVVDGGHKSEDLTKLDAPILLGLLGKLAIIPIEVAKPLEDKQSESFWKSDFHRVWSEFWKPFSPSVPLRQPTIPELFNMLRFWNQYLAMPQIYLAHGIPLGDSQPWINIRAGWAIERLKQAAERHGMDSILIRKMHEVIRKYQNESIQWGRLDDGSSVGFQTRCFATEASRFLSVPLNDYEIKAMTSGAEELERLAVRLEAEQSELAIGKPAGDAQEQQTPDEETQAPALTNSDRVTLQALGKLDPSHLVSALNLSEAMPAASRLSERTVRLAIKKLIELDLAERPEGPKKGVRLTRSGRRQALKTVD